MNNIIILILVVGIIVLLQNKNILEKLKFYQNKDFIVIGLILLYIVINRNLSSLIVGIVLFLVFYHKTILKYIKNKDLIVEKFESIKGTLAGEAPTKEDVKPSNSAEPTDNKTDIFEDLEKFKAMSNRLRPDKKTTEPFKNKVREIRELFKQIKNDLNK
jgi:Ca2+/Na+ antiporter